MATLVEFTVSTDEFPLGRLFTAVPEATAELERLVPTGGAAFPYVWIRDADRVDVTAALEASTTTETFTLVDEVPDRGLLYRARWRPEENAIVGAILEADVTLLSATGRHRQWTFRLRADDHDAVSRFQDRCRERDVRISVSLLRPLAVRDEEPGITPAQLEALELAYERGYFDDPRRATLDDLATELGITRQSLAGRLRRGHRNLLAQLFRTGERSSGRVSAFSAE